MKDDLPWFKHYNIARNHPKMKALRGKFGPAGYGRFWMLNEIISDAPEARLDLSRKINILSTAEELGLELAAFEEFLAFLSDPEIDLVNYTDGILTTDQTQEDYSVVEGSRGRKRGMGKTSAENKQNAAEKTENAAEKINRAEQSRAEENRIHTSKQAVKSNPARSEPADDSACLPDEIKAIKAKIKSAPFPSSFSNTDLIAFALRIQKAGTDAGFVDYCIDRAAKDRKTEKPAGLFKLGLLQYNDWLEEYKAKPPKPGTDPREYETLVPDLETCTCGEKPKVNRRLGEATCSCGRSWTYNQDWEEWREDVAEKAG